MSIPRWNPSTATTKQEAYLLSRLTGNSANAPQWLTSSEPESSKLLRLSFIQPVQLM